MHEEDYGILWKHNDLRAGPQRGPSVPAAGGELHRHRRQLRLRLLLVLLPGRDDPVRGQAHRHPVDHGGGTGRAAPVRVDGGPPAGGPVPPAPVQRAPRHRRRRPRTTPCTRWTPDRVPPGPDNPWSNAFESVATLLETEHQARRVVDPAGSRGWKIVNPHSINRLGIPVGLQARARLHADAARRSGLERGPASRLRHLQPVGHPATPPTSGAPPATIPTSTPAATASRA